MLEFDLICASPFMANLTSSDFFLCGMLMFLIIMLADKFGRKPVLYCLYALTAIFYFIAYFINSGTLYILYRGLCGILQVQSRPPLVSPDLARYDNNSVNCKSSF
jgi:MFS family permease